MTLGFWISLIPDWSCCLSGLLKLGTTKWLVGWIFVYILLIWDRIKYKGNIGKYKLRTSKWLNARHRWSQWKTKFTFPQKQRNKKQDANQNSRHCFIILSDLRPILINLSGPKRLEVGKEYLFLMWKDSTRGEHKMSEASSLA